MAEEQSLPPLPAISWSPTTQSIRTRKRGREDAVPPPHASTSSDPAWFSSDDDPSVENYTQGRRKKRYVGSWFSQNPTTPSDDHQEDLHATKTPKPAAKRTFQRHFDSGVWMGSDTTATDFEDNIPEELSTPTRPGFSLPKRLSRPSVSSVEEIARAHILHCVERAEESIDLTGLGLDSISNDTIAPLSEFTCIPIVAKEVSFEHREPSLKLYLARNTLGRVPGAVFDLRYLSVLSIRRNALVELAPAVAKLESLEELNVSQNSLRYLPAQLLRLIPLPGKLKKLHIHPNPFCQPKYPPTPPPDVEDSDNEEDGAADREAIAEASVSRAAEETLKDRLQAKLETYDGCTARILARSPVHYNDSTGTSYSQFQLAPPEDMPGKLETEPLDSDPLPPISPLSKGAILTDDPYSSRVPSLLELSLLAGYKTFQLADIPNYLSEDAPQYMQNTVQRAINHKEEGGRYCCVCGRLMIVPRTAWLEWWEIGKVSLDGEHFRLEPLSKNRDERAVPFLKQGCSWKCVPRKVETREWIVEGDGAT